MAVPGSRGLRPANAIPSPHHPTPLPLLPHNTQASVSGELYKPVDQGGARRMSPHRTPTSCARHPTPLGAASVPF